MRLSFTHILRLIFLVFIVVIIVYAIGFQDTYTEPDDSKLLFVHIPKNAGSYVESILNDNNIKVGKFDDKVKKYNKSKPYDVVSDEKHGQCSHWHIPPKYNKNINFDGYITFAVLRDPIDRILSEYNWVSTRDINHDFSEMIFDDDINSWVDKILSKPKDINFVHDCHILPQLEFLTDVNGNMVENILLTDNIVEDLNDFLIDYGYKNINIKPEKINNSKYNKFTREDLSPESIEKIKNYYKDDYELIEVLQLAKK